MVDVSRWTRDWRAIVERMTEEETFIPISSTFGDEEYELLRISRYSAEIDGKQDYVSTPIRRFDDNTGFFTHRTRDTGMGRFITRGSTGRRMWVLESGTDLLRYNAMREGLTVQELIRLMRHTLLGHRIIREYRKERQADEG